MRNGALSVLLAVMCWLSPAAAQEEQFSWRRDGWADRLCANELEVLQASCRRRVIFGYEQKLMDITDEGQKWIGRSCPESVGITSITVNGCVARQIDAMLKPGWPTLDKLPASQRTAVSQRCPQAKLSPSEWRSCVEAESRRPAPEKARTEDYRTPPEDLVVAMAQAEDYARQRGKGAVVFAPGKLRLAGTLQLCGMQPTVMDPTLDADSKPLKDFLVLNPSRIKLLPPVVQRWLYARGCAFRFRGPDPLVADCFATARGNRQGWMTPDGVDQVCAYVTDQDGGAIPERCMLIRKCALLPGDGAVPDNNQPASKADLVVAPSKPPMPTGILSAKLTPEEIYKAVSPSVYLVVGSTSVEALKRGEGVLGSAVAVAPHVAITNCHVVRGQNLLALTGGSGDKDVFVASVADADGKTDRCFLTVQGTLNAISAVRHAGELAVGERVYSIGNPSGLMKTLGEGIISGLRQADDVLYVQTTAQISQGSSGGALVDATGALVGVTTMIVKDAQNVNFAIAAEDFWK
ncbi:MAG: trypsin-like peptidase domain-containing protein [Proteobacteria bacterium]|nr:trypsin-like peptidase domain-containing protein [Pseudomonadota bacterium]